MLHHVTLEVTATDVDRFADLLAAIGFAEAPVPDSLGTGYRWFESGGTQVHLAIAANPTVPTTGHSAYVVAPLGEIVDRLDALGFDVEERRRHWGAQRVVVAAPGGHRVELIEAPPGRS